jgi:hypothetical protein
MLPDLERAERIGEFWGYPQTRPSSGRDLEAGEGSTRSALHHRHRASRPGLDRQAEPFPAARPGRRGPRCSASSKWEGITPAQLAPVGFLDGNQGELKNETFTLVGYGVDIGEKKEQVILQARHSTTSYLKNVQDEVVVFQINDKDSKAGGGSCFGDSGGPVFLDGFVLGDASYVNSFSCNATGSYQRVDTTYAREFLSQFLD